MGLRRPGLLIAVVALTLAAQSQPTFYAAYEDGLDASKQGQWKLAVGAFQRAVALRPEPAARVIIYGNNLLKDYYPYSRLAKCYLELGDLESAVAMFGQAERRGEPAALREPLAHRLIRPEATVIGAPSPAPAAVSPRPPSVIAHGPAQEPANAPGLPVLPVPPVELERKPVVLPPSPPGAVPVQPGLTPPLPRALPVPLATDALPVLTPAQPASVPQPEAIRPINWSPVLFGAGLVAFLALLGWRRRPAQGPARTEAALAGPSLEAETIGPYRTLRILGQGGFATTYLAHHSLSGREVALKVLHPHRLRDPEFVQRFALEAKLGALLEHPALVRLLDPGPAEGTSWIALEYVAGPTLAEYLQTRGPLPLAEAVAIALRIAQAIAYAHAHGVIHRDLKPGNIIIGADGPKVMDLGLARELDSRALTTTYAFMGTPLYAAPEAQLLAKAGPGADRYSLGAILFEMIAGQPPYSGETPFAILDQHRSAPVPDLAARRQVPPDLARLVQRLLDKDPDQRPEDGELVAKLQRLLEDPVRLSELK